ncbi:probable serine/threonine-protein kinase PBL19 isoform X1 [Oryza brachyantha]|uniref:probable serine/threonine-protein kinase PBL19 isoform X1 n=1 Tax=Oryza brachyantha TaxID=4533 RepID=UPI001ADAA0C8|nr:probable serine/threonine-protein kinase PBL19 isoform X1 [Oryza brachyantha]
MGCFAFRSGKSKAKNRQTPAASGAKSSDGQKSKPSAASSTPARSIHELSEERGAQRLRVFDLDELSSATNGFSRALKIGEGGFGPVYRAFFRSGGGGGRGRVVLAVKRLNQRSLQGHKQWLAEVQFLGVLEHPNLVRLVGYCAVDSEASRQRLLVYEFMPNKSLDDHLFNRAHPPLSWRLRLQIMIGAARGLDYLHEGLQEVQVNQVIYRDFKAANVLLDADFNPKLSDFGLAREGPTEGKTHVSTAVVGTHGYAAPDYIETGHLTAKSDVWSFGVVLYEILTGRRSVERSRPAAEQKLLGWVRQHPPESHSFRSIMDPRLGGRYTAAAARQVARLADRCLAKNPKERPAMREVVEELERALQMEPPSTADKDGGCRPPPPPPAKR